MCGVFCFFPNFVSWIFMIDGLCFLMKSFSSSVLCRNPFMFIWQIFVWLFLLLLLLLGWLVCVVLCVLVCDLVFVLCLCLVCGLVLCLVGLEFRDLCGVAIVVGVVEFVFCVGVLVILIVCVVVPACIVVCRWQDQLLWYSLSLILAQWRCNQCCIVLHNTVVFLYVDLLHTMHFSCAGPGFISMSPASNISLTIHVDMSGSPKENPGMSRAGGICIADISCPGRKLPQFAPDGGTPTVEHAGGLGSNLRPRCLLLSKILTFASSKVCTSASC